MPAESPLATLCSMTHRRPRLSGESRNPGNCLYKVVAASEIRLRHRQPL